MPSVPIEIKLLGPDDSGVLEDVDPDVFDEKVQPDLVREFLADPRSHLAVALEGTRVIGMASAFHYVHPDKRAQLFINEVGVAETHQRRGIGRRLVEAVLDRGRELGCTEAWVATELDNEAARGLYIATGGVEDPDHCVSYTYRLGDES